MREKSDGAGEADVRTEGEARRIDLSLPQVAGSALAAVVAAKLASSFGVYGTILGAGVISVVATCGGSVLQHFFKRTGEQLRVKRTGAVTPTAGAEAAPAWGEFSRGTVYRARTTGWKRPVIAAALVFGVAMAGITTYELASGENLSGGHRTTVGNALSGHNKSASDSGNSDDPGGPDGSGNREDGKEDPGGSATSGDDGAGSDTPSATPSGTPSGTGDGESSGGGAGQDGGTATSPTPTPEATGDEGGDSGSPAPDDSATAPAPGASSRSGTDGRGQGGPAAQ
ncbi:hypothetical protein OH540_10020 [Streptomyces sp. BPPL-273]|uniref:hypothetical protein n=1 Tax=Streptomyces sp. BPPL-273 TaxID=2987533 RepID=UPI0024AF4B29|nr:hypothetical protein [Streptomyces sp. BPPL-273]WHM30354.1 hypothetical protein OH540_10020 [Streptomyces sp. BPPL-273]